MEAALSSSRKYRRPRHPSDAPSWHSRADGRGENDADQHAHRQRPQQRLQADDDKHDDFRGRDSSTEERPARSTSRCRSTTRRIPRRGSYKPTPLKWPFLVAQMVLLAAAIAMVLVVQQTMPLSDNSAVVDGRPMVKLVRSIDGNGGVVYEVRGHLDRKRSDVNDAPPPEPLVRATVFSDDAWNGTLTAAGKAIQPSGRPKAAPPKRTTPMHAATGGGSNPATNNTSFTHGNLTTDPVIRWSTDYANIKPTKVTDGVRAMAVASQVEETPDDPATVQPSSVPAVRTIDVVVAPTITATMLVTAAPQTSFDPTGSPVIYVPTTETIIAVGGGSTTKRVVVDDGLVAETHTIITVLGGTPTTVVSTPPPQTVVTIGVDGAVTTMVTTPSPQTLVAMVGGSPVTLLAITTPGKPLTETVVSVIGGTEITVTPPPVAFVTDLGGGVLVTTTSTPAPYVTTTGGTTTTVTRVTTPGRLVTTTMTTAINGTLIMVPTVLTVTPTPSTRMIVPTGSSGNLDNDDAITREVPGSTPAQYFGGTFVPTIVAVALAVPISIIDVSVKLFQPFWALAQPGGADGPDSMTLRFDGVHAVTTPLYQLVKKGQPVPFVTTLLLWLSWLMAPLAAEAVGFKVHGTCSHLSITGCGIAIGVSPEPAHALLAVMAIMVALLAALAVLLHRWETGLHSNPWSVAAMASLSLSRHLRDPLVHQITGEPTDADLDSLFRHGRFRLGSFATTEDSNDVDGDRATKDEDCSLHNYSRNCDRNPTNEYGIVPLWDGTDRANANADRDGNVRPYSCYISAGVPDDSKPAGLRRLRMPFLALTYTWRAVFMALLLILMAIIIYYHLLKEDNAFELFMDSQAFGVKFLFAALGVAITFFWTSFFMSVTTVAPFMLMEKQAQPAETSILLTRPTNSFYGAYTAARQRNVLLLVTALMAVASEILPILLSNIPYTLTQTLETHVVCTYTSLVIMAFMILVLGGSMFVRWPHMPVDPRTVAGAAYYVADSAVLLRDVVDYASTTPNRHYFYGRVVGSRGRTRMAIDGVDHDCH